MNQESQNTPRILIIEDDEICLRVTKLMFEHLGCVVDVAEHGAEAETFLHNPYDLIIIDLGLPDIDGFKLTHRIKTEYPANQNTPVVAQTANITDLYIQKAYEVGMEKLLKKPVKSHQFKALIDEYLEEV